MKYDCPDYTGKIWKQFEKSTMCLTIFLMTWQEQFTIHDLYPIQKIRISVYVANSMASGHRSCA